MAYSLVAMVAGDGAIEGTSLRLESPAPRLGSIVESMMKVATGEEIFLGADALLGSFIALTFCYARESAADEDVRLMGSLEGVVSAAIPCLWCIYRR